MITTARNRPHGKTILFVDDDPVVSEVGRLLLTRLGYHVLCAENGFQALDMYGPNKHHIDLVILDMRMPGLSGEQTFKALQEVDDQVKVIISSGFTRDDSVNEVLNRGGIGFIAKPWDMCRFKRMICEATHP